MPNLMTTINPSAEMSSGTFNRFVKIIYDRCGIALGDNKKALVKTRIAKRMRQIEISSYDDYLKYVIKDANDFELSQLLDAISTNVTSFYRESSHFDWMNTIIKQWVHEGATRLRLWSSACSSGEEPFTMAIEIMETIGSKPIDVKILATDLSASVLKSGQRGEYSESSISPVPKHLKLKYFTKKRENGKTIYVVKDQIRNMVVFRQFNLNSFPYPLKGPLDIIFCRNVMIYFDKEFRDQIVREFKRFLKPNGYLFLGHSESLSKSFSSFNRVSPSIYEKQQ